MTEADNGNVLLIGASGYIGGLVAAALLTHERCRIFAPIRGGHTRQTLIESIKLELATEHLDAEIDFARLITIPMPPNDDSESWLEATANLHIDEIIHCAGSVDYFDSARLKEANIDLTTGLIALGKQLRIDRLTYMSTAFSCGFMEGVIPETLHAATQNDPTEYTRSKRDAEALVATSGLPFLIVRPSIVIGDSRDGHYFGKPYGIYQYWTAFEKLLCDRYRAELHLVAPKIRLQLIHQDAFIASFLAARSHLPDNSFVHLVSRNDTLPTVREATDMWIAMCARPRYVYYYNHFSEVPSGVLDRRMKMWLEFTSVNGDISAHPWQFKTTALDDLCAGGLKFRDATIDTIYICQQRFVDQSSRLQAFLAKLEQPIGTAPNSSKCA